MSFRTKGSPPVTRILSTPEAMKHRALPERCTPALLGGVDGNPIAIAHDTRDAVAQPCQQRIGVAGTLSPARGHIRNNGLGRGHAAAAVGADGAARTALAPTADVETGDEG